VKKKKATINGLHVCSKKVLGGRRKGGLAGEKAETASSRQEWGKKKKTQYKNKTKHTAKGRERRQAPFGTSVPGFLQGEN